ncbi:uncharacterized protein [Drosophila tropicalis]|uniref:uncharacterized protein n=1 Tax=Drosophila tropicalis TaxID=46794 RepID=UPI0035ABB2B5
MLLLYCAMAEKQTLDFLWKCSLSLSSETQTERMLKSYYITTCRKLAKRNVQLPTNTFGWGQMCARCGNQWNDGNYDLRLKPSSISETPKRLRQVAKLDEVQQKGQDAQTLSRGAKKRAKWLKKRMPSNMIVDCSLCRHKTMLPLEKHKRKRQQTEVEVEQKIIESKDVPAVNNSKKKKKGKKNSTIHPSPTVAAATTTKTAITKATATTKKQKGKTKATLPPPPPPSKTQKKNALLQLAAQLKAHASKDTGKTPQNRLQAFLK